MRLRPYYFSFRNEKVIQAKETLWTGGNTCKMERLSSMTKQLKTCIRSVKKEERMVT